MACHPFQPLTCWKEALGSGDASLNSVSANVLPRILIQVPKFESQCPCYRSTGAATLPPCHAEQCDSARLSMKYAFKASNAHDLILTR